MSSLNKVQLIGNLGQDPEIRYTSTNQKIAHLSVATSERWKDRQTGNKQERTEWHRVVVFGKLADIVDQYYSKGMKVYVEGQLQTRKWQNQDGKDQWTTEIVLKPFNSSLKSLTPRDSSDNRGGHSVRNNQGESYEPPSNNRGGYDDLEDEIPF